MPITIIYKDHTKYNVIYVNKNNNNSKTNNNNNNNNGKSHINTNCKR